MAILSHRGADGADEVKFGIVTTSSAELEHLATYLGRLGLLQAYAHPFLIGPLSRWRTLGSLPRFGDNIKREMSKRSIRQDLDPNLVESVAPMEEILGAALAGHLPWVKTALINRRNKRLAKNAKRLMDEVDILIASHGTGWQAFREHRDDVLKVLNYQNVHHQIQFDLMLEEVGRPSNFDTDLVGLLDGSSKLFERFEGESQDANLILVGSQFVKSSFVKRGIDESKIRVVPYGVDIDLFSPSVGSEMTIERFDVLFVGAIGARKGVPHLLDAYAQFRKENTTLTLIGNNYMKAPIPLSADESIRVVPRVQRMELPSWYRKASVFVLPSLFEGMPMVVLEAMACGIPVIVTDRGADEVVRDGIDGFVVPAGDANAIAARLQLMYENPNLRRSLGINARAQALQHSWVKYASRALDVTLEAYRAKVAR